MSTLPDRTPTHLRRARLARRVRLVMGLAAGAFVVYRIVETYLR